MEQFGFAIAGPMGFIALAFIKVFFVAVKAFAAKVA